MQVLSRRSFIHTLTGVAFAKLTGHLNAAILLTPSQTPGPFYPTELPLDDDNDLTRVVGINELAKGEITDLTGHILGIEGRVIPDARIEIWQTDVNGRYRHPAENGKLPIDVGFQGHGSTTSNQQGKYHFRTIRPVAYPGRAPHIHVAVFLPDRSSFITQLYVEGEAHNSEDFLYRGIRPDLRHLVTTRFISIHSGFIKFQANWDIVIKA